MSYSQSVSLLLNLLKTIRARHNTTVVFVRSARSKQLYSCSHVLTTLNSNLNTIQVFGHKLGIVFRTCHHPVLLWFSE